MKEVVARCQEWLPRKNRRCASMALPNLSYCGNHKPSNVETRVPCPVDPSHTILEKDVEAHARRCPGLLHMQKLEQMSYYCKGLNGGSDDEDPKNVADADREELEDDVHDRLNPIKDSHLSSRSKRSMFNSLSKEELKQLIDKIELAYELHCTDKFEVTIKHPGACNKWISADMDRRIPFQEKHVLQQASMLGNMESFGLLQPSGSNSDPVFVEFGAGRGYLAHMLADCYNAQRIVLVERRSYKFKADRTLRQNAAVALERVRIDIEDLDLSGVTALQDCHYVAFSKHLCGHATDLTLRCCKPDMASHNSTCYVDGIAIATCCHHLCQWKPYVNKEFFKQLGFSKKDFHILTWLTSGAVSGNKGHCSDVGIHSASELLDEASDLSARESRMEFANVEEPKQERADDFSSSLTCLTDRAELGLKCKRLLDVGRCYWLKEVGMKAKLVAYISPEITPENTLLIASHVK